MTLLSRWEGEQQRDEDLNRKFAGSYILAQSPYWKGDDVCFVIEVSDGCAHVRKDQTWPVDKNTLDIVHTIPESGIYQLENKAAILRRNPLRQFTEGLHPRNTVVTVHGNRIPEYGFDLARKLFASQVDCPLNDALGLVKEGQSLRLNNKYWVRHDLVTKQVNLMRFGVRLGSWVLGKFFSNPNARILEEEMNDELNFHARK